MSEKSIKTLVSFVLISYNQEKFIREAVKSALAQSYEPLEIIISDDCSTDKTFEIITEEVNNYSGSHIVQAIRNDKNLGLIRNLEKAVVLANGELLVVQAGDDISLPHRTEVLSKTWQTEPKVDLICSDVYLIDENGETFQKGWNLSPAGPLKLEDSIQIGHAYALGCAAAYTRRLFTQFTPIPDEVYQEDNILTFRALLLGGIRIESEQLVGYRQHNNNIYAGKTNLRSNKFLIAYTKNKWGINVDRLKAWEIKGYNNNDLHNQLIKHERLWFYRKECIGINIQEVFRLMLNGLRDGLTVRNIFGLLKLNLNIKLNEIIG